MKLYVIRFDIYLKLYQLRSHFFLTEHKATVKLIINKLTIQQSKQEPLELSIMSNKPSLGLGTKLGAAAVRHGDNKGDLNVIMID